MTRRSDATTAVVSGRRPHQNHGAVNPPVYHASTILYPTVADLKASRDIAPGDGVTYAVHGTPGSYAFEEAVAALEGGFRTRLCQSGLTACSAPLLAYLSAGDHLLMTDSVYGPTRNFCNTLLKRMGVETTYYDPLIGGDIRTLIRPNTKVVFVESPGSWTFEVQDIPAIAAEAKAAGATVIMDNTWASPLYFKPFEHGVDVSVQAVTKYIAGHSDLVMGCVTTTKEAYPVLRDAWAQMGLCAGPDDVFSAMRGLRTIHVRLPRHWENGLKVAEWLKSRPEVAGVIHPAMDHDPGHTLWQRDFLGASSLFAFTMADGFSNDAQTAALLDHSQHFGMGFSWGGFESLMIPINPRALRTATKWPREGAPTGQTLRIHIGLEDPDDLIADIKAGFRRMADV